MIDVTFETLKNGLCEGTDQLCKAMVKVGSKQEHDESDFPLNLAIVIDNSGSMHGPKLEAAKEAASGILEQLSEYDCASIGFYSDDFKLIGTAKGKDKDSVDAVLSDLHSLTTDGMTNLHKGWLEGASSISNSNTLSGVRRVLLLTDGQANRGITDTAIIVDQVSALAERGISTSTMGIGEDFNEELLTQMATYGQGNAYYSEEAEDLLDGYQEELQAIKNSSALNVILHVQPMNNVKMEIKNRYVKARDGWKLPHLSNGGEIHSLFDFWIDESALDGETSIKVAKAFVTYQDLDGKMHKSDVAWLKLDILPSAAFDALAINPKVKRRDQELEVAALRRRIQSAAYNRDWQSAERLLAEAKIVADGDEWLSQSLNELERLVARRNSAHVSKEAWYMAEKLNKRQVARDETWEYSADQEFNKSAYLRRKMSQGKRFGRDEYR